MATYTARFLAYCGGESPDAVLARDRDQWPGGRMIGFILWTGRQWRAWEKATGYDPREPKTMAIHDAFDAWLTQQATAEVPQRDAA